MDSLPGNVTQRCVDHALALEAGDAGKGRALDLHGEMRFAAAVIAGMAVVTGAVVGDFEPAGREGVAQQPAYFLFDRSAHCLSPGVHFIPRR